MGAYVKFNLGITHFAHIWTGNFTCNLETKAFTILARNGSLNPRPTGNMSAALPSELSRHVDITCSIIIWTSQCVLDVITFSAGECHPSINTYFSQAVRCHANINILVKWHLTKTKRNQSTYSIMRGSSEARWWNPGCVNTYKVSTLVYHRLHTKLY